MDRHILTLMRHAKSSWKTANQSDHDRPLNDRGHRDAPIMAQRLIDRSSVPDLILSSSAVRALMTAEHLMENFGDQKTSLEIDSQLYLASPSTILNLLTGIDPDIEHVLVIAHNPGLEDLSAQLIDQPSTHLPTAAIRQFDCPAWPELNASESRRHSDLLESTRSYRGTNSVSLIHTDQPKN